MSISNNWGVTPDPAILFGYRWSQCIPQNGRPFRNIFVIDFKSVQRIFQVGFRLPKQVFKCVVCYNFSKIKWDSYSDLIGVQFLRSCDPWLTINDINTPQSWAGTDFIKILELTQHHCPNWKKSKDWMGIKKHFFPNRTVYVPFG